MNAPRCWREIKFGMGPSDDIRAVGRMLRGLLGDASTNSSWKTGNYGEQMASDVARARSKLGLPGDANTVGGSLFVALYPYVDEYGEHLNANQPSAVTSPTPSCKRLPLTKGMQGKDIAGAQRALWRALQGASTSARNGTYGDATVDDVRRFRQRYGVNVDDSSTKIGAALWAVLTRWMDQEAVDLVHAQPGPAKPPKASDWDDVGSEAWWAYLNAGRFLYAQVRPMPHLHDPPVVDTDCSGLYTACCESAGVPNPNRSDGVYDGYGYTGTLQANGRWTDAPRRGDACLYGSGGESTHVAVYLGDGTCVSFGSDPVKHLDVLYRDDFMGYRTYH